MEGHNRAEKNNYKAKDVYNYFYDSGSFVGNALVYNFSTDINFEKTDSVKLNKIVDIFVIE